MPRTPAGSFLGPTMMKSLYITSLRTEPKPAAMNLSSSARACTSTTSASPFSPSFSAAPVPTDTTLTLPPYLASNTGNITFSKPEFSVLVVVAIRMSSADHAVTANNNASRPAPIFPMYDFTLRSPR